MKQITFLKLLTRVVNLYQRVRMYNTAFIAFTYQLVEKNGQLTLYIQFPDINRKIRIHCNDSGISDEVESLLRDVEELIKKKQGLCSQY